MYLQIEYQPNITTVVVWYWGLRIAILGTAPQGHQLHIPKGHNSEWFLFWKVLSWRVIIAKIFILKGHYFEDFLSWRVIILKDFYGRPNMLYQNFERQPFGIKIFGIMTLRIKNLSEY